MRQTFSHPPGKIRRRAWQAMGWQDSPESIVFSSRSASSGHGTCNSETLNFIVLATKSASPETILILPLDTLSRE